jgi:hypothetical protein
MLVTEITVSVGSTINLGDYNSGRLDFVAKATLDDPVEPNSVEFRAAFKELSTRVNKSLRRAEAELYPETK